MLYWNIYMVACGQQYFRVKPHDTSVVAGRTAELHCHVANRAGLVQWSKDGFLLGYEPEIPGYERYEMKVDHARSAYTLLVHGARLDDEAEFQCQVGPGKNEKPIRSVARLTVLVPPTRLLINDLPNGSDIEVKEAEKVVLQCQALSSKPATILKWYRKNIELMPEASRTTVRREGEKLYSTLSSITLYPKGDSSGSAYTCEALHPALERPLRTTVTVGVLYPPRHPELKGYEEDDLIHAGDHLTLRCTSTGGKPRAELQWYRNGELVQGSFSSSGRDSTSILSFTVRGSDNNALYTCAASNPLTQIPLVTAVKLSVTFPPSIVVMEGPSEATRGEMVTINCRSDASNPPSELTWMVDGVTFEPQDSTSHSVENGWYTTSNLTAIVTRQNKNLMVFTCIAQNSPRQERVFQIFNVSILYPPEAPTITGYEDNLELREGDHQSLTCSGLAGNPPAELRWYKNDVQVSSVTSIIKGHISSIISFEVDASDNEVNIRCEVNNSVHMEPLASEMKLTVLFPPQNVTISVEPAEPREGETVQLECWSGSSNPAANILWWKNDLLIPHLETYFRGSATKSRISVSVTAKDHGSRFTCEARNDAFERSVKEHVTLSVFYAPVFPTTHKVVELLEGRSGNINMVANSYPSVHSYRWSKNGSFPPHVSNDYSQRASITSDGSILYFNQVSRKDAGIYTCVAQNVQGTASATLTLNVLYLSSVTNLTTNLEVAEGETAQLDCFADGNPLAEDTISWRRQDALSTPRMTFISEVGHSSMTISNVSKNDAGVVECIADNKLGRPSVRTSQIVVLYKPTILKHLQRRVAAEERNAAELTCIADGNPDVTFAWSFNGSSITTGQLSNLKHTVRQLQRKANHWTSMLTVQSVTQADYGVYTCIAGNALGHDFVALNIVKKSIPDPPDSLQAINLTHDSALLSWISGFDGGLLQSFQMRLQRQQEVTFIHIPINSSSYHLRGLQQGTLYNVAIAAKNALGDSQYTLPIDFRTKSLPVMDSTVSRPATDTASTKEWWTNWILLLVAGGTLTIMVNGFICIICFKRKGYCRSVAQANGSPSSDDDASRQKIVKKIPSEENSPFYLTGTSVDMPVDGDTFQKVPGITLHQMSREPNADRQTSGRQCDYRERQWGSPFISPFEHEHCPDLLKRESCHCHSVDDKRISEAEVSSSPGAAMYGMKESELHSNRQDYMCRDVAGPPHITLTTFQSKSELPIRHTIIGPKLETMINGHDEDS